MTVVTITSKPVVRYLEKLSEIGVYGTKPGSVATHIVRTELIRLIEAGVLKTVEFVSADSDEGDDD